MMTVNHILWIKDRETGEFIPTLTLNDRAIAELVLKALRLDGVYEYDQLRLAASTEEPLKAKAATA